MSNSLFATVSGTNQSHPLPRGVFDLVESNVAYIDTAVSSRRISFATHGTQMLPVDTNFTCTAAQLIGGYFQCMGANTINRNLQLPSSAAIVAALKAYGVINLPGVSFDVTVDNSLSVAGGATRTLVAGAGTWFSAGWSGGTNLVVPIGGTGGHAVYRFTVLNAASGSETIGISRMA